MPFFYSPLLFLFLFFVTLNSSYGQSYGKAFEGFRQGGDGGPIRIQSSELEVLDDQSRLVYRGDVKVRQGSSTVTSNSLTVRYGGGGDDDTAIATATQKIEELHFVGDVIAVSGDESPSRVSADSATYLVLTDELVLEGNVSVSQGDSHAAEGCKLTINLGTNRASLSACGGQVNTTIDPNRISDQ